jgi:hypothetical protein
METHYMPFFNREIDMTIDNLKELTKAAEAATGAKKMRWYVETKADDADGIEAYLDLNTENGCLGR